MFHADTPSARTQLPSLFGARQARSNGSLQVCGAISWWIDFGPHEPGGYAQHLRDALDALSREYICDRLEYCVFQRSWTLRSD
jgi:hypothetical protein